MAEFSLGRYVDPRFRTYLTVSGGRVVVADSRDGAIVDDNGGFAYQDEFAARAAWHQEWGRNPEPGIHKHRFLGSDHLIDHSKY